MVVSENVLRRAREKLHEFLPMEMGDEPHMEIFAHLTGGETIPLHVSEKLTIGEVKEALCSDHGYEPDQNSLTYKEKILNDASTLASYHIKKHGVLKLAFTMVLQRSVSEAELSSDEELVGFTPRAIRPDPLGAFKRKNDLGDGVVAAQGSIWESSTVMSRAPLSESLKKILAAAALHGQDAPSPSRRRDARKLTQEKATSRLHGRATKEAQTTLGSVLCDLNSYMFLEMLAVCTPCAPAEQKSVPPVSQYTCFKSDVP